MFIPIDSIVAKNIKNLGHIDFRIFNGWEAMVAKKAYRLAPNRVVYVSRYASNAISLFECVISMGSSTMIVDNLDISQTRSFLANYKTKFKAMLHFYLGFVVDKAIIIAEEANKSKIIIRSILPGIANILVERDFIVRPSDTLDKIEAAKGFKGLKKLQEALH